MRVKTSTITEENKLLAFMDQGGKSILSWLIESTDSVENDVNGLLHSIHHHINVFLHHDTISLLFKILID